MYAYEDDGRYITSPGKFEGEPRYVPYIWGMILNGWLTQDQEGDVHTFTPEPEDIAAYPELASVARVKVWEDDIGFVHSHVYEVENT